MLNDDIDSIGSDWILKEIIGLTVEVKHTLPSIFNEKNRYLPKSVTNVPGYIRYDVTPYTREIVDCFDIDSDVREVSVKKGVQISFTTSVLEAIILYYAAHIKTTPQMYITADKELAKERVEGNIIPMFNMSKLDHVFSSSDVGNKRKSGKTAAHLQFSGGGYLIPYGAQNATKMRQTSIQVLSKDEIDGWPDTVGRAEEDPDTTTDDRCSSYWDERKILRGSTPLIKGTSKIQFQYLRGDQRKYYVKCVNEDCKYPQVLRWEVKNNADEIIGGFRWDYDEEGALILESVRYICPECGQEHFERDKEKLFSKEHGAKWIATSKPVEPGIRSYHLPAFYSPIGMQPWHKCVSDYLKGYDPKTKKVINIPRYQRFYNNILGEPFEVMGSRVRFDQVSAHRRTIYSYGTIPNKYAIENSGSPVLLVECSVDVHKDFLAVKTAGWCKGSISYLVDYWKFESNDENSDCRTDINNQAWQELRELIEKKEYTADDGKKYKILSTLIDANGVASSTVIVFCAEYANGVTPILGRERAAKTSKIKEFSDWDSIAGVKGKLITVDHYKDRIASSLRRNWVPESGPQSPYHLNFPVDITNKQLEEMHAEVLRKKTDPKGRIYHEWHRPGNKPNELWDLYVYGSASVEMIAYDLCINQFELETIDWARFWEYIEVEKLYFTEDEPVA